MNKQPSLFIRAFFFIFILFGASPYSLALEEDGTSNAPLVESQTLSSQLDEMTTEIKDIKSKIKSTQRQLKSRSLSSEEVERLTEVQKQQELQLSTLSQSLEQLATGGTDLSLFIENQESKNFDWKKELQLILQPMLSEMRRLTEGSRALETLRARKKILKEKQEASDLAVSNITNLNLEKNSKSLASIEALKEKWISRQEAISNELELTELKIRRTLNEQKNKGTTFWQSLKDFASGRGLHILICIGVFIGTIILLKICSRLFTKLIKRIGKRKDQRLYGRLVEAISEMLVFIIATLTTLFTLIILGDWLLLTLITIALVFTLFAVRNSIPNYIEEMKTLLNLGAVREGERLIYNGIPWRLSKIHIYSTLVNPALTGGVVRLPLRDLSHMTSRRYHKTEAWFPTKQNDYVILADGTYGQIHIQTPEVVGITLLGNSQKVYSVSDFLSQTPRNLSNGFGLFVEFGLDYNLQSDITTNVLQTMNTDLNTRLMASNFADCIDSICVEFSNAGASSLDLLLMVKANAEGAPLYFALERFIKRCAVDICNTHDWGIPFNQLTVHMEGS